MIQGIPLEHFLIVSTIYVLHRGLRGSLFARNLITMLMATELILNSVNINFVVFNRYLYPGSITGTILLAVHCWYWQLPEASVAIALIINIYRKMKNIEVENVNELKY